MANLYTPPNGARVISSFAPGDYVDVVNWPAAPSSVFTFSPDADTLLVMPFYSDYVLNYDSIRVSHNGTTDVTWGLYSYEPSNRSGSLLNATGGYSLNGNTSTDRSFASPGTIYPGRTYAVALNSSASWTMNVYFAGGNGCSRILGVDWTGVNTTVWTHLRASLAYNATLPPTLPAALVKNNALAPPNPFFNSI
jgi:hypothetical protein